MPCAKKPKQHKEMVGDEGICSSCFEKTKYSCLTCGNYFCMRCSVFLKRRGHSWVEVGNSVAYCGSCFNVMMERESSESIMTKSQDKEVKTNSKNKSIREAIKQTLNRRLRLANK